MAIFLLQMRVHGLTVLLNAYKIRKADMNHIGRQLIMPSLEDSQTFMDACGFFYKEEG